MTLNKRQQWISEAAVEVEPGLTVKCEGQWFSLWLHFEISLGDRLNFELSLMHLFKC